jgi:1-acyl-sn-glycerol-3-phosphate acyltransferase
MGFQLYGSLALFLGFIGCSLSITMITNSSADMAFSLSAADDSPSEHSTLSRLSPWLAPMMYALGKRIILPAYFSKIEVIGQANIPTSGPVVLAPTHRARWDSLIVGLVGKRTGRYLRFMVTADECVGLQGWLIRRLGGFPVHVRSPSVKSLRHGVELLQEKEMMVIYPEGNIFRDRLHSLKPGLARIALRAERSRPNLDVKIVPISLEYSELCPKWRGTVKVRIGTPISVAQYKSGASKLQSKQLTADLQMQLSALAQESTEDSNY